MFFLISFSVIASLFLGFLIGASSVSRRHLNERLSALGLTRNTRDLLDEATKIIKWLESEEAAMTGISYDSEIRVRMDRFLNKVKKEYV